MYKFGKASKRKLKTCHEDIQLINSTTDGSGQVTDIRSLASDQPIIGWVRKGTNTPRYRQSPIAGTIDSATGLDLTVVMVLDE